MQCVRVCTYLLCLLYFSDNKNVSNNNNFSFFLLFRTSDHNCVLVMIKQSPSVLTDCFLLHGKYSHLILKVGEWMPLTGSH